MTNKTLDVLAKNISGKKPNELINIIFNSELLISDIEDWINLFESCSLQCIEKYGINFDEILNQLYDTDINNADTLMRACDFLHKQKRQVLRVLDKTSDEELKTFWQVCAISERSCYDLLKHKYGIHRTVSQVNDETDFVKY